MKRFLLSVLLVFPLIASAQWQPLGMSRPFSVTSLVQHKDKAYAIIERRLCAGDRETEDRYAFYPIDASEVRYICSWGDYFVTANLTTVTIYSDVSIGQKLISKTVSPGTISSIAVHDSILLIGTYQGIFQSTDTLKTMVSTTTGTSIKNVVDIKRLGKFLYAATDSGVHVSYNQGALWQRISAKAQIKSIGKIADTLYAATNTGLFFSTDTGKVWARVPFFGTRPIQGLSQSEDSLYICTHTQLYKRTRAALTEMQMQGLAGEYKSVLHSGKTTLVASSWGMVFSENAKDWTSVISPLASNQVRSFNSLVSDGKAIFGGTDGSGGYISYDGGVSWEMRSPPFHYEAVYSTGAGYYTEGRWFARTYEGAFRSSDEGKSWQKIHNGLPERPAVNCFYEAFGKLWLGTSQGIYYSTDFGDTWLKPDQGITSAVRSFARSKNGKLFAFANDTLYSSAAPYTHWNKESLTSTYGFASTAQAGDTIYTGSTGDGLYRSFNGGLQWELLKPGIAQGQIGNLAVTPDYVLATDGNGELFIRTHDDTSWTNFGSSLPYAVQEILISGDTVYAAVQFDRVYRRSVKEYKSPLAADKDFSSGRKVLFYPNPAREMIHFSALSNLRSVEIQDMAGRVVIQSLPSNNLSLQGLQEGVYIVKTIMTDGTIHQQKLLKH